MDRMPSTSDVMARPLPLPPDGAGAAPGTTGGGGGGISVIVHSSEGIVPARSAPQYRRRSLSTSATPQAAGRVARVACPGRPRARRAELLLDGLAVPESAQHRAADEGGDD